MADFSYLTHTTQRLMSKFLEPISLYAAFTEPWARGGEEELSPAPGWRGWAVQGIQGLLLLLLLWVVTGLSANYPYCASLAVFCAGAVVLSGLQPNISRGCWTLSQLSAVSNGGGQMDVKVWELSPFLWRNPRNIFTHLSKISEIFRCTKYNSKGPKNVSNVTKYDVRMSFLNAYPHTNGMFAFCCLFSC